MRKALFVLLAAILSVGGVAFADDGVNNGPILQGTLSSSLSSATAQVGDPVVINDARSDDGSISGTLYGHVTQVQKAAKGQRAQLSFVVDHLATTSGATYAVTAVSRGITPPGANSGKETTAAVAGALAGALLGKALGHSSGAMIAGLIAGAGTAFLLTSNNYQDVSLPQGSTVKVLLKSVTRVQSSGT